MLDVKSPNAAVPILIIVLGVMFNGNYWPMVGGDPSFNRRVQGSLVHKYSILWTFKSQWHIDSSAVVDGDGNIYFGGWDGLIYSISRDGNLRWKLRTKGLIWGTPCLCKDVVAVASGDMNLYILKKDGTLVRRVPLDSLAYASLTCYENCIYALTENGGLYKVDASGNIIWRLNLNHSAEISVSAADGRIFASTIDTLYIISTEGEVLKHYYLGCKLSVAAAIFNSTVYLPLSNGCLLSLRYPEGVKWILNLNNTVRALAVTKEGNIYLAIQNMVYLVNGRGQVVWKMKLPNFISTLLTDEYGSVIAGAYTGEIYILSNNTFQEIASLNSKMRSQIAPTRDGIVALLWDGRVVLLGEHRAWKNPLLTYIPVATLVLLILTLITYKRSRD